MPQIKKYLREAAIGCSAAGVLLTLMAGGSVLVQFLLVAALGGLLGAALLLDKTVKSSVKQLATISQTYQALIGSLSEGVLVHTERFAVRDLNEIAERTFSLHKDEILGLEISPEMLGSQKMRAIAQVMYPTIAGSILERKTIGGIEYLDVYFSDPSPTYLRIGIGKVVGDDKTVLGYFRIFADRTAEVLGFQQQAEFLSIAAHQLRTPLTQIRWVFETLRDTPGDKEILSKGLEVVAQTLVSVDAILNMVKIEGHGLALVIEEHRIDAVIREALESLKISFTMAHIAPSYEEASEIVPFKFDRQKIHQVVVSLLDNAIRYNHSGGSVRVELKRVPDRPYALVSISDTGIGIPQKEIPLLFQKFYRGSNVKAAGVTGFGIGLYISKRIVEAHGGTFSIQSKEGEGTTVSFTLPLQETLIPR